MLKSIFNTATLKLLSNFIMLAVLWLTVHYLGDVGRGEIAIFNANLALVVLINGFVGSSVIIYLTPRTNFYNLLIPAYIWGAISSFISPFLLQYLFRFLAQAFDLDIHALNLENSNYYVLLVVCSFLGSMFEYNYMVLIGKQKFFHANMLNFMRHLILLSMLVYFFIYSGFGGDVFGFFVVMILAYFIGFVYSLVLIIRLPDRITQLSDFKTTLVQIIKKGFVDQLSNVLQFLNKRIPMYTLFMIYGRGITGVLSVAITLTEAFLFLTQSISTVQYAHISNNQDSNNNVQLTAKLFRLSLVILSCAMLGLLILPDQIYILIFKESFANVRMLMAILAPGIIAFGCGIIMNHYFSGINKFEQNVYSNLFALAVTIGLGAYYIVPEYGIWGAALTPTISNFVLMLYLMISFKKSTKMPFKEFIPKTKDIKEFMVLLRAR